MLFFYFPVMTIVIYLLWWGDKYLESHQQNTFSEQVSNFEARQPQDPDAFF
jgi:hypothetical protein